MGHPGPAWKYPGGVSLRPGCPPRAWSGAWGAWHRNPGQWACIAVEADDLLAVIAEEAAKNVGGRPKQRPEPEPVEPQQLIVAVSSNRNVTATKAATLFQTNRTYINQASKMKEAAPEVFEKVKAGKMTMQDANRAVRAIPVDPWLDDEKERKAKVEANQKDHGGTAPGTLKQNSAEVKPPIETREEIAKLAGVSREHEPWARCSRRQ